MKKILPLFILIAIFVNFCMSATFGILYNPTSTIGSRCTSSAEVSTGGISWNNANTEVCDVSDSSFVNLFL